MGKKTEENAREAAKNLVDYMFREFGAMRALIITGTMLEYQSCPSKAELVGALMSRAGLSAVEADHCASRIIVSDNMIRDASLRELN